MPLRLTVFIGLFLCFLASSASAQNLFQISATNGTTSVNSGGSSVISLVSNLSNNSGQFGSLQNQPFNANLNYAGIKNAITFQQSFDTSGNRILNFKVPSVGVSQTFNSADGSLGTQLKDYLKKDGLADLTAFQQVVGQNSFAGIVDGNPLAMTAQLQDAGYEEFALHAVPFDLDGSRLTNEGGGHFVSRYWFNTGTVDAGGTSGSYFDLTLALEAHFNEYIGLTFTTPLRYEKLHSADIYMGGEIVALPITIIPARGGPITWQITPAAQAGLGGSQDFVSGGLLYGGQIDNSLSLNFAGFTFTLADGAGYDHGANISIDGYSFNTDVNQWIFKNGLQLSKAFGNFFIEGSGTYTNFLHAAYTRQYVTPELAAGFRFGAANSCGLRIGFIGNYGPHYNTTGGNILLYFTN